MIKLAAFKRPRPGFRHDAKRGVWLGWRVDAEIAGRRYRNAFATKSEAERFLAELRVAKQYRRAGLAYTAGRAPRISEVFAERLKAIAGRTEARNADTVFRRFRESLGFDPPVTDLRKAHFQKYINVRFSDGVMASTIAREITLLSAAIRSAAEMFPDQLEDFEPPRIPRPRVQTQKGKGRVITEQEKDRILDAIRNGKTPKEHEARRLARPVIAAMFELAWMLGLRLGEVRKLKPSDYDRPARSLRVIRWKTGAITRFDHLPGRAAEILEEFAGDAPQIFLLACSLRTMYSVLSEACAACGLEYGRSAIDGVTFHATRHSFTTRLVEVTDLATAQSFTGHANKQMIAYYSHASDGSRRAAMERMYGSEHRSSLIRILEDVSNGRLGPGQAAKAIEALLTLGGRQS